MPLTHQDSSGLAPAVPFRMRADLHIQRRADGWMIKDPISLRYFQLSNEEYFLLCKLDGRQSLEHIRDEFERQFAPRRVHNTQLQSFLSYLHDNNLIVATMPGHSDRLLDLGQQKRRRQITSAVTNVLAIRFRGVDPERFLGWLYPKVRWTFTRPCLLAGGLLIAAAMLLVAVQFSTLQRRLPDFREFFSLTNVATILLIVGATKVLHELSHALTARHFGCECHEIGFMLLVFTPCLYCNVSDAWTIPGRWQRIAISAAGMYVELVLAAVCTFLWWFSEPGLLNTLCLNQMFVSSVTTVLFNGNPLLRYDGYYILSDLVNEPNLQQESRNVVQERFVRDVLGVQGLIVKLRSKRRAAWLAAYAVAATACRVVFVGLILWFYLKMLEPYELKVLAQALGLVVLTGMVVVPTWRNGRQVQDLASTGQVQWPRALLKTGIFLAVVMAAFTVPLPRRVAAKAVLQSSNETKVYVAVPGRLTSTISAGTVVSAGQLLVELENVELKSQLETLKGRLSEQRVLVSNLHRRRFDEPDVELQIPAAADRLRDLESQHAQLAADYSRLKITAPIAGTVLPPPRRDADTPSSELPTWDGTPLEQRNLGMHLDRGTLLCSVGEPRALEAWLHVEQDDVEFVAVGQTVTLYIGGTRRRLSGIVTELAEENVESVPRRLARQIEMPVMSGSKDAARPANAVYFARVDLAGPIRDFVAGTSGKGAILVPPMSLAARIKRYLQRTFRFSL